jgi:hypothetical protein
MAPAALGQLVHHLKTAAAECVGGRATEAAAGHVPAQPAGERVEDLAHQFPPRAVTAQVKPQFRGGSVARLGMMVALDVQGVGRELADHRDAVIYQSGLDHKPGGGAPEQAPGNAGAGWVPGKRPGTTRPDLDHPQPVIHLDASGPARPSAGTSPATPAVLAPAVLAPIANL